MEVSENMGIEAVHLVIFGLSAFFAFAYRSLKAEIQEIKEISRRDDLAISSTLISTDEHWRQNIASVHGKIEHIEERLGDKIDSHSEKIGELRGQIDLFK